MDFKGFTLVVIVIVASGLIGWLMAVLLHGNPKGVKRVAIILVYSIILSGLALWDLIEWMVTGDH